MKYLLLIAIALLMSGCTVSGKVSEEELNKLKVCTDTRDGEKFIFNTNTVYDVRAGFENWSFSLVDTNGSTHHLTAQSELYLKCKEL